MKNTYSENYHLYRQYMNDIEKYPLLSKEEEKVLLQNAAIGNSKALNKLICANLRFVIKVAFLYRGQGLDITDLINEGNIGLIKAAERYELEKNVKFISYAVWWVRQAITQAIFEKARLVRISAEHELIIRRLYKKGIKEEKIIGENKRSYSAQINNITGMSSDKLEQIIRMGRRHKSLDSAVFKNSAITVGDRFQDTSSKSPYALAEEKSLQNYLTVAMEQLEPRERNIIKLSYGLESNKAMHLQEIGDVYNLSKERVRQIKENALNKLKGTGKIKKHLLVA